MKTIECAIQTGYQVQAEVLSTFYVYPSIYIRFRVSYLVTNIEPT